jgi:hypothetical protein
MFWSSNWTSTNKSSCEHVADDPGKIMAALKPSLSKPKRHIQQERPKPPPSSSFDINIQPQSRINDTNTQPQSRSNNS